MPIVGVSEPMFPPHLPGTYYVRVSFDGGDERGRPFYEPLSKQGHLDAYSPFLHTSKEEAIGAFSGEESGRLIHVDHVDPWSAPGPLDEPPPLGEGYEYICLCRVQEDGEVDCVRRVAQLDTENGTVTLMNWDEDFLISWPRDYIFASHGVFDSHTPPSISL
jgi:hypothetical protein